MYVLHVYVHNDGLPDLALAVLQIRASVHYFNNEEDLDKLMRVLRDVIRDVSP